MAALTPAVILAIGNFFLPALVVLVVIYYVIKYSLLWQYRLKNRDNLLKNRSEMPFAKFLKWGDIIVAVIGLAIIYLFVKRYF
ncbi:MAG: hypothetical protein JST55_01310 [Bacteroidetes bacterium]|nr:hypothetical protein [Bacteroidota bacterium]